jgi:hypothetical protein
MKACVHFSRPEGDTYISFSNGYEWNAWITVEDPLTGRLIYQSFQTGLMAQYLEHLRDSMECRKEVKVSKRWVDTYLKDIEETWREIMG